MQLVQVFEALVGKACTPIRWFRTLCLTPCCIPPAPLKHSPLLPRSHGQSHAGSSLFAFPFHPSRSHVASLISVRTLFAEQIHNQDNHPDTNLRPQAAVFPVTGKQAGVCLSPCGCPSRPHYRPVKIAACPLHRLTGTHRSARNSARSPQLSAGASL